MLVKLVCLTLFVAYASALVCSPDVCQLVRCAAVTEDSCNGKVVQNGGYCGCCDACVMEIMEGDLCMSTLLMGVPSTSQCTTGTTCDPKTYRCTRIQSTRSTGPCAEAAAKVNAQLQASGGMLLGLEVPRCYANGDYLGMQFSGSQAYCVTKDGTAISGYMVNRWEAGNMTCDCARDLYNYMQSGLIGKLFYCEPNGNYKNHQHVRDIGPCAAELARVTVELFAAQQSGQPLLGLEKPRCDADGNYAGMQVKGSQAYCVTKNGTAISGYMVNRWEAGNMNCQCARDQYEYMQTGLIGKMFHCDPNGNYNKIQCMGSVCYCVDMLGARKGSASVSIVDIGTLNC